jgi:hypothetical protein
MMKAIISIILIAASIAFFVFFKTESRMFSTRSYEG